MPILLDDFREYGEMVIAQLTEYAEKKEKAGRLKKKIMRALESM